jgi:hypothetical protein
MLSLKAHAPRIAFALAALFVVPGSSNAQSIYESLFGSPAPRRAPRVDYLPSPYLQHFLEVDQSPLRNAPRSHQPRIGIDENSIPAPPVMPLTAKPARFTPDKELVASIMADSTLRRGDIVVFPDGPRVYRGDEGSSKRAHDFEDLRASRLVSNDTRKVVLAATRTTAPQITVSASVKPRAPARDRFEDVVATGAISAAASR